MPNYKLDFASQVDKFIDHLEFEKKYSKLTLRNYSHYLKRFVNFVINEKINSVNNINAKLIIKYRESLEKLNILSKKTIGFHLISVRSLFKWMNQNGQNIMSIDQIDVPKVEANKLIFLNGKDIDRLLTAPDINSLQGKRDRAILELFYATGLRISEVTSLDKTSLNTTKNELRVGSKCVFLSNRSLKWLNEYLAVRIDKEPALFVSQKGKVTRLTPRSIERMLKKYTKQVGLPTNITPKALRHSYATDLLLAGEDLGTLQKMLGHKNISTTQIYTHVTNKQLHDIHETFHGRGK